MWGSIGEDGSQDWDIEGNLRFPAPSSFGDRDNSSISTEAKVNAERFIPDLINDFYAAQNPKFSLPRNTTGRGHGPFFDPIDCFDNEGQRFALCFVLDYLEQLDEWEQDTRHAAGAATVPHPPPPFLRVLLLGEAGSGKSFVLRLIQSFVLICDLDPNAFFIVAPTGAAGAALCAPTADRAFKFNRTSKSPEKLKNEDLLSLQARYRPVKAIAGDESSMWGQIMFGNFAERTNEVFNNGCCCDPAFESALHPFGKVPLFILGGDFMQLPPVLDQALYSKMGSSQSAQIGYRAFNSLKEYLYLDKPERQGVDCPLFAALSNLRRGHLTDNCDLAFWNSRSLMGVKHAADLQAQSDWDLHHPRLLYVTCYNKDRDNINQQYVIHGLNVVVVRAACTGGHAISSNSHAGVQALRIPRTSYFFIGMTVLLSVNLVPELGLANNTRGTVVDILYPSGGYTPDDPTITPVVVVDFPGYTGPIWEIGRPTCVPIHVVERRCDHGCCSRTGIPLWSGKAGSVHSFQGLTVGDNKQYQRIIFHWDRGAEGKWPGAFYVGASRAMAPQNISINTTMTKDDLEAITKGDGWKNQRFKVALPPPPPRLWVVHILLPPSPPPPSQRTHTHTLFPCLRQGC